MTRDRMIRIGLLASLALNIAIVGVVAGAFWRFGEGRPGGRSPDARGFAAPYVVALPRAARREVAKSLRKGHPEKAERRAQYDAMLAALRAEPWDRDAARSVLDAQAALALTRQGAGQAAWLAVVDGMSSQSRAAYAERLEELLERGPRWRKKRD